MRSLIPVAAAALILASSGCSKSDAPPATYPVGGKVVLPSGETARGAEVRFIPKAKDGKLTGADGSAVLGTDGAFALKSMGGMDGVPPGYYAVVVTPQGLPASSPDKKHGIQTIPKKYWSEDTTDLMAEVTGSKADYEFRLTR